MNTLTHRRGDPVTDMLTWLEADPPLPLRGLGLAAYIRVEDFAEDGAGSFARSLTLPRRA